MKKTVQFYLRSILLIGMFLVMSRAVYANHIEGMDLSYTWVSGNTYQITLTAYGNCGATTFPSLATATPTICVYNGNTSVTTVSLTIVAPTAGTEITPVCAADIGMTTCTSTTLTIPGIKKFVYTGTYTLPSTSAVWRFVFNGYMGATEAGRSSTITNITNPGTSIVCLIDTLNNTTANNTSPTLTVGPTPYYCLNNIDDYNPGAVAADGDSLVFYLVAGKEGTGTTSCTVSGTTVTYAAGYSATAPISSAAGTFSFSSSTGQVSFNPNLTQNSLVVYNIEQYRAGVLVGTSQREMSFLVQTCTNTPANGPISNASNGYIVDSTHFQICENTGAFTFHVNPTESNPANNIKITASSLPTGSTFTVTGDSTNAPQGTFSWNSTGVTPGTYTFFLYFVDDNCPIAGTNSVAYNVIVEAPSVITGTTTLCAGATATLSNSASGGTWSSATPSVATIGGTGIVTGISGLGTSVITYVTLADCSSTTTVTVNPNPAAIAGNTTVCAGSTTSLSDATAGGIWSSGTTTVATIAGAGSAATAGGVATGTSAITYKISATGCANTTTITVTAPPGAIAGTKTVCIGSTTDLSDVSAGGTWSSSNTDAVVSGTGVVTGEAAGTPVITYTTGSGCTATTSVTVNALPAVITPAGAASVCIGTNLSLSDATGGGVWSSSNTTLATVSAAGVVRGVAAGSVNISYTNGSGCYEVKPVSMNTAPTAISPNPATVCTGLTVALSDGTAGGAWSSSNTNDAAVSSAGVVTGVAGGNITITYAIGSCSVTSSVTVKAAPVAIAPASAVSICIGTPVPLSDATGGGVWTSSNTTLATVSGTGVVMGVVAGSPTITYTSGGCFVTKAITVNTSPSAIAPASASVCVGTTTILSDAVAGGAWSSSSTGNATVDPVFGIVTGVAVGSATITYSIGTCTVTVPLTINSAPTAGTISGATNACAGGLAIALSDGVAGGVWSSGTSAIATISAAGVVSGVAAGPDIISYSVLTACGTVVATYPITVTSSSGAGTITGLSIICAGTYTVLTASVPGGAWSIYNSDASITGTGLITGITPGVDTVYYTVTNSCGVYVAKKTMTIGAFLTAGTISGPTSVCAGSSFNLSDGTPGGVWSSSNSSVATISGVGVVSGVSSGTTIISYLEIMSCGSTATTYTVTVNPLPAAGTVLGPSTMCAGTFTILSDAVAGGVWSSSNTSVATISSGGLVYGITGGTTTISYTFSNSCGSATASQVTTISPAPSPGTIIGASIICAGSTIALTDAVTGGVWSISNGHATVSSVGIVTGVSIGADTVIYSLTTGCGTVSTTKVITVDPSLTAGTISGPSSVCVSSLITLSDAASGGVWSSGNADATITTAGVVTGITPGADTITYSVFGACGLATSTKAIVVVPASGAGTITGPTSVCPGGIITLSDAFPGGVWSTSNSAIATIAGAGVLTGSHVGTDTIYYTLTSSCGTNISSAVISVSSTPVIGAISGPSSVCIGTSITLTNPTSGGVWSAGNADATVSGGVVDGITMGADVISYTVTNSCGTSVAMQSIAIVTFPIVTLISGPSTVCVGSTISLSDETAGGVWNSTNTNASISAGGVLTGVATGSDIITYLLSNACGTVGTSTTITINPLANPGTIIGPDSVCAGSTMSLFDGTPGGIWSAGNANATVSGGIVTGVSGGTVPISYTATNSCGPVSAVQIVTVVAAPDAGTISGPSTVCVGAGITLADAAPGGTWLSSNVNATIVAPGVIDGVTVGTDTVYYLVNNACGAAVASYTITVNPDPVLTPITGVTHQCVGTVINLSDATTGGDWYSSSPPTAAVSLLTGVTNGLGAGVVNITYTVTNALGCPSSAIYIDTVMAIPVVSPITGSAAVCVGAVTALSNSNMGGVWSSSNTSAATVDTSGNVNGVAAGTATITYAVVNTCGSATMTITETVNPLPATTPISGTSGVCVGSTVTLSDAIAGGVWGSSNTTVAIIGGASGVVTGISPGIINVIYTVTSALGCSAAVVVAESINAVPVAGTISGNTSVCIGSTSALSDTTSGGIWSSSNTAIATVNPSTGLVSGVAGGALVISYTVTAGSGCSALTTIAYVVNTVPAPTTISGIMSVCAGASTTLSNAVSGGVWSSTNGNATVSAAGIVTGVIPGTDYIIYAVSNGCGAVLDSALVTINALPFVAPITALYTTICSGANTSLSEPVAGGVWSSSNTTIAIVSTTGVVTGLNTGNTIIGYSVTNSNGCVGNAAIAVYVGPAIPSDVVSPPGSATLCHGVPVYLQVVATGGGVTYQWLQNGATIPGATNSGYTTNTSGTFSVILSNGICSETSAGTIVVAPPNPVVLSDPPNILYTGSFTSYQWYLNGVPIPGDTTSLIYETGTGYYTVVATDVNGCSDTSSAFAALSVGSVDPGQNIKIYPNPANAVLHIDAPVKVNVRVLSIDGKIVISQNDAVNIDVHELANGMYMIMIYDENNVFIKTTKFAKIE